MSPWSLTLLVCILFCLPCRVQLWLASEYMPKSCCGNMTLLPEQFCQQPTAYITSCVGLTSAVFRGRICNGFCYRQCSVCNVAKLSCKTLEDSSSPPLWIFIWSLMLFLTEQEPGVMALSIWKFNLQSCCRFWLYQNRSRLRSSKWLWVWGIPFFKILRSLGVCPFFKAYCNFWNMHEYFLMRVFQNWENFSRDWSNSTSNWTSRTSTCFLCLLLGVSIQGWAIVWLCLLEGDHVVISSRDSKESSALSQHNQSDHVALLQKQHASAEAPRLARITLNDIVSTADREKGFINVKVVITTRSYSLIPIKTTRRVFSRILVN